jgi:hypothetical protein
MKGLMRHPTFRLRFLPLRVGRRFFSRVGRPERSIWEGWRGGFQHDSHRRRGGRHLSRRAIWMPIQTRVPMQSTLHVMTITDVVINLLLLLLLLLLIITIIITIASPPRPAVVVSPGRAAAPHALRNAPRRRSASPAGPDPPNRTAPEAPTPPEAPDPGSKSGWGGEPPDKSMTSTGENRGARFGLRASLLPCQRMVHPKWTAGGDIMQRAMQVSFRKKIRVPASRAAPSAQRMTGCGIQTTVHPPHVPGVGR